MRIKRCSSVLQQVHPSTLVWEPPVTRAAGLGGTLVEDEAAAASALIELSTDALAPGRAHAQFGDAPLLVSRIVPGGTAEDDEPVGVEPGA